MIKVIEHFLKIKQIWNKKWRESNVKSMICQLFPEQTEYKLIEMLTKLTIDTFFWQKHFSLIVIKKKNEGQVMSSIFALNCERLDFQTISWSVCLVNLATSTSFVILILLVLSKF